MTASGRGFLGLDVGTSGVRGLLLDESLVPVAAAEAPLPAGRRHRREVTQDPSDWWRAVCVVVQQIVRAAGECRVVALACAATSASVVLSTADGTPAEPAAMYDDARAVDCPTLAKVPPGPAADARSSLAKVLWWAETGVLTPDHRALHQADWLVGQITGEFGVSDWHNALKLGYDVEHLSWPAWFGNLPITPRLLPRVVAPGTVVGTVTARAAAALGLPIGTPVMAGTTDSVAAFLASGASQVGDGVSAYGSTLALKQLSMHRLTQLEQGVYSHRLGPMWLAGGASNTGGRVLAQFFSPAELADLTAALRPEIPSGLHYYPLPRPGERFPTNDPRLPPRLRPRPADRVLFLQGLLEGMADIEAKGYALLARLGGPALTRVYGLGRPAANAALAVLRARGLRCPLAQAARPEPGAGAALLAALGSEPPPNALWQSFPLFARLASPRGISPGTT